MKARLDYVKVSVMVAVLLIPLLHGGVCEEMPEHGGTPHAKQQHSMDGKHNEEYDHEAVIGSRAEHEEFENLSPEEARRRLSTIVTKMDTNSDDIISKQELIDWVFNSFNSLDAEEASEYFEDQDNDKDGKVTAEEYIKSQYSIELHEADDWDKDKNPEIQHFAKMIADDKEKFKAADINKDGGLDAQEYVAFYHPWTQEHMHALEIDRALEEHDQNQDGYIDMAEYLGAESEDVGEQEIMEKENFKAFDRDSDGRLDRDEIKHWVIPDHKETAEEEADHLFEETDLDRDGKLSRQEILDQFELWVGSAATDYGLQLEDKYHDPQEL